jgi:hypothetical protein
LTIFELCWVNRPVVGFSLYWARLFIAPGGVGWYIVGVSP